MALLSGPTAAPQSGGKPTSIVVLLHGWGASGDDLIGLAPSWARVLPEAHFVSPHAPEPCDQNPFGRQWFSFVDSSPAVLAKGAAGARAAIDAFIDAELGRHGLGDDRVALVGFSQGAMMALYVGVRRAKRPAAVLGYSGAMIGGDSLATEIRSKPPILLVHGDADQVVPIDSLNGAMAALAASEVPAQFHVCAGLGHGIDEEGLALGGAFLRSCLA
ncbi:MAG: phospholipase [Alphaproteobacteria bacterium]|nr:phospholipase [Alphaproteobacteria bacterium]